MFKSSKDETGYLSILYAIGPRPLSMWDSSVNNGHLKRLTDADIESPVIELIGANVNKNFITCPADPNTTLGISMHTIVLLIKSLRKYFSFEILILDSKNIKRRFRACNFQVNHI